MKLKWKKENNTHMATVNLPIGEFNLYVKTPYPDHVSIYVRGLPLCCMETEEKTIKGQKEFVEILLNKLIRDSYEIIV